MKNLEKVFSDAKQIFDVAPPSGSFSKSGAIYRGHGSSSWTLTPSLFRIDAMPREHTKSWESLEAFALSDFKAEAFRFLDPTQSSKMYLLQMAQHFGMPTRLLDWSRNPLVALFFAVENLDSQNDGTFIVCTGGHSISGSGGEDNNLTDSDCFRVFPHFTDARITAQQSAFTIHNLPPEAERFVPVDEQTTEAAMRLNIEMYKIPRECKSAIKLQLEILGTDRGTLFPGLDGVGQKMRWQFLREAAFGFPPV